MPVVSNGYVPEVNTTTANFHDSKGSVRLIAGTLDSFKDVVHIKADIGYAPLKRSNPASAQFGFSGAVY